MIVREAGTALKIEAQVEANTLYFIHNGILCFWLFIVLIYTTVRMFKTKPKNERYNLARLAGAQFDPVLGRLFSDCRPELEKRPHIRCRIFNIITKKSAIKITDFLIND